MVAAQSVIEVTCNGAPLDKDTDYTVTQDSNVHKFVIAFRGNYTGSVDAAYEVNPEALQATATAYSGIYDGVAHTIAVTADAETTVTYSETKDGTYSKEAPVRKDVGTTIVWYKVEQGEKTVTGSALISITPASLTVTADDKTMYVGDALPSYSYTVSGWQGSDKDTAAFTAPKLSCSADGKTAGSYTITASGANAGDNYTISYVDGTLTVYTRSSGGGSSSSGSSSNTKTTTVKNPDGSTTTTVINKTTGVTTVTTKLPDGTTGTTVTDKNGEITEVKASVPAAAAAQAAESGETVTLPVEVRAAKSTEDAPAVQVTVPKAAGSVKVEIPVKKVTPGTVAVIVKADGTEEITQQEHFFLLQEAGFFVGFFLFVYSEWIAQSIKT